MNIFSTVPESRLFEEWRQIVKDAGGDFVGIQAPLGFDLDSSDHKVIFTRRGSTNLLSIPVSKFTHEAVEEKLGKKVTSVQKMESGIKKLLDEMRDGANKLIGMADQLEEELKECLKQRL